MKTNYSVMNGGLASDFGDLFVPRSLFSSGGLWGWGRNNVGQLGTNSTVSQSSPVQTVSGGTNWRSVAGGYYHTAAIKTDGTLWLWGNNGNGQLGVGSITNTSSPSQPLPTNGWNSIQGGAGYYQTIAIKSDGTLWTWGQNGSGQLGNGSTSAQYSPVQTIAAGTNWVQCSTGRESCAAIKTDGTLWTWGSNGNGRLGDNTGTSKSSPVQTVSGGTNWKLVASGDQHTAAIKTDGTLWLWGYNGYGQLGDNTTINKSSPVQTVSLGTNWSAVSCGYNYTAAIKTDGTLWLWGDGYYGQLGNNINGTTSRKSSPVQTVAGGTTWRQVNCINGSVAAIKTDGTLWTWGSNNNGALGNGAVYSSKSSPIQTASGGTTWKQVGGSSAHFIAVKTDGTLWTWGDNGYGQIGNNNGGIGQIASTPVQTVSGGTNWKEVAGSRHSAAIKTDGTLWTWGQNNGGQLGNGSTSAQYSPILISSTFVYSSWQLVTCSISHTAAIQLDGSLWTWGSNQYGQLGDNTTINKSSPVQTVSGGTNWKFVSCSQSYTAAVKTDGTLWTWGYNVLGQLGDNTTINKSSPVQTVSGGTNWKLVSAGGYTAAAIKTDGTLWTWGASDSGRLGDNTTINKSSPVQTVSGGTNWKLVASGDQHTTAIKTDGTLWTWGSNFYGQLGDNTQADRSSPVQTVSGGTNWKSVAIGFGHTAAMKTDGTLWCWGYNNNGQLGITSTTNRSSPVQTVAGGTNWKLVNCGDQYTVAITDIF